MIKKLKRDLMPNRVKKAKRDLELICHTYIKKRDSVDGYETKGYCFDCGKLSEGSLANAGHWIPSGSGGAILRYHPNNIHLQHAGCNCGYQQELVKINYTRAMYQLYGEKRCTELVALRNRTVKADIIFYENLIMLYKNGTEQMIIDYLENHN